MQKAGHIGTLDPFAFGIMVIAIGKATKAIEYLISEDKEYIFKILWGVKTDSFDITGNILSQNDKIPTEKDILDIINNFKGEIEQVPPIFSAIKINGKRAYSFARIGVEIEIKPRKIHIYLFKLLETKDNKTTFFIKCSKGTYIRAIARDISKKLDSLGNCFFFGKNKNWKFRYKKFNRF